MANYFRNENLKKFQINVTFVKIDKKTSNFKNKIYQYFRIYFMFL